MKESIENTVTEETVENVAAEQTENPAPKEEFDEDAYDTEFSADMFNIKKKPVYSFFKRLIDIVISIIALLVIIPFGLILSIVIVCESPGASPIYVQKRVGKNGKKFKFFKFRSMVPGAEKMQDELEAENEMVGKTFKMKNDPRMTKVGKVIRKRSIDELPQFWNVLKGDMSIVGPRPPLVREVAKYSDDDKIRLAIKPGLTCYWQTMPKRNELTSDDWFALDVKYINERSLWTDIKIFFKTFRAIIFAEGM